RGKGDLVDELKEKVIANGVGNRVFFTGMIHEEDMAAIYSYADIFSLISEVGDGMGEGIPLTPLEAMACGTPIIVGNQDGSREAIFSSLNGYIVDPFDLDSHVKIFMDLLSNSILLEEKSKNAQKIASDKFSFESFLEKHKYFFQNRKLIY
ncbi:MAG TPA: glycosyltransferase, partial [Saprospiraceae bacterium]|nr:glycosyltransferase [Saprospiraceae bacterium]